MAISGWGVFLIILVLVLVAAGGGYVLYAHYRARKLGLPAPNFNPFNRKPRESPLYRAPAPAPSGVIGWVTDKFSSLRSGRTTTGAYESTGYGAGGRSGTDRRGFGPLDPDEAWDARVDNETGGYYEEQELGLQDPSHGPYGGGGYGDVGVGVGGIEEGRGRSRSRQRELDNRYDEEVHNGGARLNPFGEQAEASNMSLRSVSPRPDMPTSAPRAPSHKRGQSSLNTTGSDDSPTERRSMFREDV
ncbi:uncharacterized protein LTR77_005669 [Saxophila tyrrhenica]|uniref:Acid phosphatase-like protein n=1 Tax=Saxophila tyrrhenica TaxID=1690608 RepID=A0AAV9P9E0_9PEZI|nr:hypothetical protein LTR77_005669 [Saxophila tyrrhenica]